MNGFGRHISDSGLKPAQRLALYAVLLMSLLPDRAASAGEPYRVLHPSGGAPHPAVLLAPGCSGFAKTNGASVYEKRILAKPFRLDSFRRVIRSPIGAPC